VEVGDQGPVEQRPLTLAKGRCSGNAGRMRALVVYESMFGNTEAIAGAIAVGLPEHVDVETVEVGTAPSVIGDDLDLIVVGGPTHAFGMSRPGTRKSAATQTNRPLVSAGTGLREWFADLEAGGAWGLRGGGVRHPDREVVGAGLGSPRRPGAAASGWFPGRRDS